MNSSIKDRLVYLFFIILFSTLTALRINGVLISEPKVDLYDSPSYFDFSLTGGVRMPLITFIYSTLKDFKSIMLLQVILSITSISFFTLSLIEYIESRILKYIFILIMFLFAISSNMISIDYLIMAESLNISSILILITFLFRLLKNNFRNIDVFLTTLSIFIFAGIKSVNGILSIFCLLILFVKLIHDEIKVKKNNKKNFQFINFFFIISSLITTTYLTSNIEATPILNTSAITNSRLWENKNWRNYALDQGFPLEARTVFLNYSNNNLGLPPDEAVSKLPTFQNWYESEGKNFLLNLMVSKPDYTFIAPFFMFFYTENKNLEGTLFYGYSQGLNNYFGFSSLQIFNWKTFEIFWPNDRSYKYIILGTIFILISIPQILFNKAQKKENFIFLKYINIILSFSLLLSYISWWFGSTPKELPRHQFPISAILYLLGILNLIYILNFIFKKITLKHKA